MIDLYNLDFYNFVLNEVLGVGHKMTGNVVSDTVYLFILPVLTLFLFSNHVASMMQLGKSKLQYVFMAIIFFFVIEGGFYPIIADYAMIAFVILLIWGAWDFIVGKKKANEMRVYNMGVGGGAKGSGSGGLVNRGKTMARTLGNAANPGLVQARLKNTFKDPNVAIDAELARLYADLNKKGLTPKQKQQISDTIKNLEQSRSHRADRNYT